MAAKRNEGVAPSDPLVCLGNLEFYWALLFLKIQGLAFDTTPEQKEVEAVLGFNRIGVERIKIAEALGITLEKVNQIIENQANK